jgi:hypothetical protein
MKMLGRFALAAAVLVASVPSAEAGLITLTNSTFGNFDASSGTRSVTVTGLESGFGTGEILDVNVSVDFTKADGEGVNPPASPGTPFYNEIVFRLTSPFATTVNLISAGSFNSGSSGTLFNGVITFDQAAAQVVNVNPNQPSAGTFRPVGNLNSFNGGTALGNWTLFIQDTVAADSLRFRSFTANITTADPIPEPATLTLTALGLAAAAARHRRRRSN